MFQILVFLTDNRHEKNNFNTKQNQMQTTVYVLILEWNRNLRKYQN